MCFSSTFDSVEASVVCNQWSKNGNGCGKKGRAVNALQFGPVTTNKVWLGGVNCKGAEACLESCSHYTWGITYCDPKKGVVGIRCTN